MVLVMTVFAAGVLGTLAMDLLNNLVARSAPALFSKIDVAMIGRMAAGWARGRYRYRHPDEMAQVSNEFVWGYLAHYTIGLGLAVPFVLGWELGIGGPPSPAAAVLYGVATSVASFFIVYPSIGLGVFGRRSPDRFRAFLSPLVNHLFYGVGLAVAVVLVRLLGRA